MNAFEKLYNKLTFYDLYTGSIFTTIFVTLLVIYVFIYCRLGLNAAEIKDNWNELRCNPKYIPFAGFIVKPEDKTAMQYTSENFQYCLQNVLVNTSSYTMEPLNYMIRVLSNMFQLFSESINRVRELIASVRTSIQLIIENLMQRLLNVVIPLQQMLIALKDTFQKIQGTMTAALYTMLGSYYTLQSLMGAIMELMVKMLMALSIIIIGLWVMPFTWPIATTMTAIFTAIAIPLSIVVYFMSEVLHVHASDIPQLRCFHPDTLINTTKIKNVKVNDVLHNGSRVLKVYKLMADKLEMVNIRGVIVSSQHKFIDNYGKVYKSADYIDAIPVINDLKYVYCFETSDKKIVINGITFLDWDEGDEGNDNDNDNDDNDFSQYNIGDFKGQSLVYGKIYTNAEMNRGKLMLC